jgi:D-proline reductase (dithiol) PrdB
MKLHHSTQPARNEVIHFSPLMTKLSECKVALVTSAGAHPKNVTPFDAENEAGDTSYREIPNTISSTDLMVSHTHYNHKDADRDINCIFPLDALHSLVEKGIIGASASTHFGFMGYNPNPKPLIESTGPKIARRLKEDKVDVVVLSPG